MRQISRHHGDGGTCLSPGQARTEDWGGRKENPECGIRRGGLRCAFGRTSVHASRVKYAYRGGDAVTPLAESLERRRLLAVTVFHIDPSRSTLQLSGQTGGYSLESWDGAAPSAQV